MQHSKTITLIKQMRRLQTAERNAWTKYNGTKSMADRFVASDLSKNARIVEKQVDRLIS